MIFNITGGGASLNFTVVGGTTAPATPQENTIWLNTSTAVTGWTFSSIRPTSTESGHVWFSVGLDSAVKFNALKKNCVQVCPVSAMQYVDGSWVSRDAMSYQGGKWVAWRVGYVFKDGKYGEISGFNCTRSSASLSGNILTLTTSGNAFSNAYSKEKINLSGVNNISVKLETGSQAYTAYFGVMPTVPAQDSGSGDISGLDVVKTIDGDGKINSFSGTYTLDVSGLSGEYYLVFNFAGTSSGNGILKISEISYDDDEEGD